METKKIIENWSLFGLISGKIEVLKDNFGFVIDSIFGVFFMIILFALWELCGILSQ